MRESQDKEVLIAETMEEVKHQVNNHGYVFVAHIFVRKCGENHLFLAKPESIERAKEDARKICEMMGGELINI